jgi:hypothetical protein
VDLTVADTTTLISATTPVQWIRFKPECVTTAGTAYLWVVRAERQ